MGQLFVDAAMMELTLEAKLMAVSEHIRRWRLIRNYSQDYIAAQVGISQNAYSKIELGYTKVTLERLVGISRVLEITLAQLLEVAEAGYIAPGNKVILLTLLK